MDEKDLLSLEKAGELVNLSANTLRAYALRNADDPLRLPARRIAGARPWFVGRDDLLEWNKRRLAHNERIAATNARDGKGK